MKKKLKLTNSTKCAIFDCQELVVKHQPTNMRGEYESKRGPRFSLYADAKD